MISHEWRMGKVEQQKNWLKVVYTNKSSFFSYHKEHRGGKLPEMARQLEDVGSALGLWNALGLYFCILLHGYKMVTSLDMTLMLKGGRGRKGEKGETAPTLPFLFDHEVEVFPEPLKRLPRRSNWPICKKNSFLFLVPWHSTTLPSCLPNAQGLSTHQTTPQH